MRPAGRAFHAAAASAGAPRAAPAPKPAQFPAAVRVERWRAGRGELVPPSQVGDGGTLRLDLGEAWAPYLFTDGQAPDGAHRPNNYRATYLALARGDFPGDRHGHRARRDVDLELYGITPTPARLLARMRALSDTACDPGPSRAALRAFQGTVRPLGKRQVVRRIAKRTADLARIELLRSAAGVEVLDDAAVAALPRADRRLVARHRRRERERAVVLAAQARLRCGRLLSEAVAPGLFDPPTRRALRAFERRHNIPLAGRLAGETLTALGRSPMEGARRALLRALTERAVHTLGVIEDGSAGGHYRDAAGVRRPIPNLRAELRAHIEAAFGLQTPASALGFLKALPKRPTHHVWIPAPPLPDYYAGAGALDLRLQYERGDVWYDFPFDEAGRRVRQPVAAGAELRVRLRHGDQDLVLARLPTTIGGWHRELVDGVSMWKYKASPVGPRVWQRIVAAPVWLPPQSTPDAHLLIRRNGRRAPDYDLIGPGYASAYGLVAAYHRTFERGEDGARVPLGDQGIRTHGTANFSSVGRGFSHGCHRLHNDAAVRLMSLVLRHRPHVRTGQEPLRYGRRLVAGGRSHYLSLDGGGYGFELSQPLPVEVTAGKVLGRLQRPVRVPLPAYDAALAAYVMPDGTHVRIEAGVPVPLEAAEPVSPGPDALIDTVVGVVGAMPVPDGPLQVAAR